MRRSARGIIGRIINEFQTVHADDLLDVRPMRIILARSMLLEWLLPGKTDGSTGVLKNLVELLNVQRARFESALRRPCPRAASTMQWMVQKTKKFGRSLMPHSC